jgi:hypothetical protein
MALHEALVSVASPLELNSDLELIAALPELAFLRLVGAELVLQLENVGAGHNFPTEERHRAVDMMYRFVAADGTAGEWQRAWRFRMPYRDEMEPINPGNEPGENTQLPAGKKKAIRVPIDRGAVAAETRLWYRLTPFVGDDSPMSTLLDEQRVELR